MPRGNRYQSWQERLDAGTIHMPGTDCLLWAGHVSTDGYGVIGVNGRPKRVHRLAYERATGQPIMDGMHVCHHCDTPRCVEPSHLFLGTCADNMADKAAKGRAARGENHGRCKLSDAAVEEIRADQRSQTAIALDYEVSGSLVSLIKRGNYRSRDKKLAAAYKAAGG